MFMKKVFTLFTALAVMFSSFASVSPSSTVPVIKASEIFIPIGKTGKKISLLDLSKINIQAYEAMSGRDMKRVDEKVFKLAQKKLRKNIKPDGTLKPKVAKAMAKRGGESGFHLGGFALGFLLGLIGVLLAYVVFDDDYKKNRIKWAWIGFSVFVVLYLLVLISLLNSYSYM